MGKRGGDSDAPGMGSIGDFFPTLTILFFFSIAWGFVQYRDGTPFIGLLVAPPLAAGMLSAASVRMLLGRGMGGLLVTFGGGIVLFVMMLVLATIVSMALVPEGVDLESEAFVFKPDMLNVAVSMIVGTFGTFFGAFSLRHYIQSAPTDMEEDDDLAAAEDDDIDYSTEPEDLVCLLTNQVVNREHDKYIVCHSKFNVTSVCHAVYLMDYVHLLDNRCRRCYQPLRERDAKGMGN